MEEVINPRAFWAGTSEKDRVLVELQGPPPFPIAVGQRVSFVGKLQANHQDPARRFGIGDQDAAQLRQQGYHVDVDGEALRPG